MRICGRICEKTSVDTKVSEEVEGGDTSGAGEIPLQPVVQMMVRHAVALQPIEDPTPEQVDAQRRL